jgi:peroxiredoxin
MSRRAPTVAACLCVWLAAAPVRAQAPAPLASGTAVPSVSLVFNGKTMQLKHLLAGNRTALVFLPAACTTCDSSLSAIDKPTLVSLGKLGFAVFAVSPDSSADQAATVSRLSLAYPLASDPGGAAASAFHVSGPALFLIDRDGRVRYYSDLSATPLQGPALVSAAQSLRRSSKIPH